MNIRSRTKIRSKTRSRNKGKFRARKSLTSLKKNEPLSWGVLDDENYLDQIIKSEIRDEDINNRIRDEPKYAKYPSTNRRSKFPKSENEKSLTFRSVGPEVDTTINRSGVKYTKIYHSGYNKNLKAGFYGSSRLTR